MTARPYLVAALALLAACHRDVAEHATVGGDEDRQLNEAAAALDAQANGANRTDQR